LEYTIVATFATDRDISESKLASSSKANASDKISAFSNGIGLGGFL
jgi:hypothetical protein